MERLTRLMIRHRWAVLAVWLVVLLGGGYASTKLSGLLANTFTVPGTDSERVRTVLSRDFGDRSDGSFTVVFQLEDRTAGDPRVGEALQTRLDRAAHVVPTGHATELRVGGPHLVYGDVTSTLTLSDAKGYADDLLKAVGTPEGAHAYVTGAAAIQAGLDPIFNSDLARGESIALPIALLVLLAVFGLSWAITMPFLFAGSTIMGTLGIVYLLAHELTMATYVTNLVQLIGLGIAIDYSLLIVYRFREELERPGSVDDAIVRTMATAGRAVIFSGATVAIGLALLIAMPIPFMRSMGIGGFLIPLVSIAAAATLQPALLSIYGRRGTKRVHVAEFMRTRLHIPLPSFPGTTDPEKGFWVRLAHSIMRRPVLYLVAGSALLLSLAVPVFAPSADARQRARHPPLPAGRARLRPAHQGGRPRRRLTLAGAGRRGPGRERPHAGDPAGDRATDRAHEGRSRDCPCLLRARWPLRRPHAPLRAGDRRRRARVRRRALPALRQAVTQPDHPLGRVARGGGRPGRRRPAAGGGLPPPLVLRVPLARPRRARTDVLPALTCVPLGRSCR